MEKIFKHIIIYLSRRNYSDYKIKLYHKRFLYIFSILFILTAFNYNFSLDGAIFGVIISLNIYIMITEAFLFLIPTSAFMLYYKYLNKTIYKYKDDLIKNKKIICAYKDNIFENKIYDVITTGYGNLMINGNHAHIHLQTGEFYYFNDYKIFKFVNVKKNRKLKLEQLKKIMDKK